MIRALVVLAVALASPLSALDWSDYDKQLHASAGFAGAYVLSDVLERTTDLPPWGHWLISVGTLTAAGWAYEEMNGSAAAFRDANDAHATTVGAVLGASTQVGVSLILTSDRQALGLTWRH